MLYEKHVEALMHYSSYWYLNWNVSQTSYFFRYQYLHYMTFAIYIYVISSIMYCLSYSLSFSSPPFTATNQAALAVKIKGGHFRRLPVQYSSDLNEIVSSMLKVKVSWVVIWSSPSYFVTIGCWPHLRFIRWLHQANSVTRGQIKQKHHMKLYLYVNLCSLNQIYPNWTFYREQKVL